jgi:dTDP-4-amino-4,6-dideoxygalactose transaminase
MRDTPAAEGGAPVRSEFLPFARPSIGEREIEAVVETLRSGWLTVGPRTREFEAAVASYIGVERAQATHSCTAGLHLGLVALGVGAGDEVITPALNFAAGPNMVVHLGATPVLVDVAAETLNVTAESIEAAITDRTKVVMPLHFAGRPCPIEEIRALAESRGLSVLGDGAHAFGADVEGRRIGSMAHATSFSFYVTKGITTGDGGAITSPDPSLLERIGRLSLHGMSNDAWRRYTARGSWYYEIIEAGYKYNMTDVQAALGLRQLERADAFREARARIAAAYGRGFADEEAIAIPPDFPSGRHAWHLYPIQIEPPALRIDRDRFIECLVEEGIGVSVHFIPIHYHPFYRDRLGYAVGAFPATETYFSRAISLPIYPSMSDTDVADVVLAVTKLARYYKR